MQLSYGFTTQKTTLNQHKNSKKALRQKINLEKLAVIPIKIYYFATN